MIKLRHATLDERRKTYDWYCHMAEQDTACQWVEGDVYTWATYKEDFEDFYFEEAGQSKGSVMIIENDGEEIGCVCYACFHLKPQSAELDIWLKDETETGKGYGTQALKALVDYLKSEKNITRFIIRPLRVNERAIKAYSKVGFRKVTDAQTTINAYMKPPYIEVYGNETEHGNNTVLMVMDEK